MREDDFEKGRYWGLRGGDLVREDIEKGKDWEGKTLTGKDIEREGH